MKDETVTALVQKTLAYAEGGTVTYAFQGGEPLVAGEAFFRNFSDTVGRYNTLASPVRYCLQTNGTLLTDSLCTYLKDHNYLVGVSLDGPRGLHDANRCFESGEGSFASVRNGIGLLKKHGVTFNILTVVTEETVKNVNKLILFFENSGMDYLQFITCLEPLETEPFSSGYAMRPESYDTFNRAIFDWYLRRNRSGKPLSIRHLDNLMRTLQCHRPEMCGTLGFCSGQLVVEGNGNCYPCDFYCDDTHLLGNICENSLEEIRTNPVMTRFVEASLCVDEKCRSCAVAHLCRGGCRRERDIRNDGYLGLNIYCEGRKRFFTYVLSQLNIPTV